MNFDAAIISFLTWNAKAISFEYQAQTLEFLSVPNMQAIFGRPHYVHFFHYNFNTIFISLRKHHFSVVSYETFPSFFILIVCNL